MEYWFPTEPTTSIDGFHQCGYCGMIHTGMCPLIEKIEYYPNGTVKSVKKYSWPPLPVNIGGRTEGE